MLKTTLATVACIALSAIRHDGKDYNQGELITLNNNDKLFLEKAGYVRTATDNEIAQANAHQADLAKAKNTLAPVAEELPTDKPQLADQTVTHPEQPTEQPVEQPTEPATLEAQPVELPVAPTVDYNKLKKAELNAELDKRGITRESDLTNTQLVALLVADDKAKTTEAGAN